MYDIQQLFLTNSNRPRIYINPKGIVIHCTDTEGASALNERNAFNTHPEFKASAHAFIDAISIIQTIPTNEKAWHAGPTANNEFLGVELCMANELLEFQAIWDRAIWLFANWMINVVGRTKVTPDNILSHAEISEKFHETDHSDPVAYFNQYGKDVDQFRYEVQQKINEMLGVNEGMKKIVVYMGDADLFAAVLVSQKNQCPLMKKSDFDTSGIKSDEVIQIGGKFPDRFATFKDAANLV